LREKNFPNNQSARERVPQLRGLITTPQSLIRA
jgi:hypothetical protein